jgi:Arc/MetJ family transcription regulator
MGPGANPGFRLPVRPDTRSVWTSFSSTTASAAGLAAHEPPDRQDLDRLDKMAQTPAPRCTSAPERLLVGVDRIVDTRLIYTSRTRLYTRPVAKHLIEIDEDALKSARLQLGTATIKDTVNESLRRTTGEREQRVAAALDVLAGANLDDRADAWRYIPGRHECAQAPRPR